MKSYTSKTAAFTLVELLVVIGIIALLVGILLPALGKARRQAQLVACSSNMRSIGQAMIQYANDNGEYLPLQGHSATYQGGTWTYTAGSGGLNNLTDLSAFYQNGYSPAAAPTGSTTANLDPGANIGLLAMTGYLGSYPLLSSGYANATNILAELQGDQTYMPIRFCPGQEAGTIATIVTHFESSYQLNPHWTYSNYQPGCVITQYRKLTDYPYTLAMATETLYGLSATSPTGYGGSYPHPIGPNTYFWNLLFRDGHVAAARDTNLIQTAVGTGGIGNSVMNRRYDDALDVLETEADGRNPMTSLALPNFKPSNGWAVSALVYREGNYPGHLAYTAPTGYVGGLPNMN
jgi:type II secretory pathway pseudopilin PulG